MRKTEEIEKEIRRKRGRKRRREREREREQSLTHIIYVHTSSSLSSVQPPFHALLLLVSPKPVNTYPYNVRVIILLSAYIVTKKLHLPC